MSASISQFHIFVIILQASGSHYKLAATLFRSSKYSLFFFSPLSPLPKFINFKGNPEGNWNFREISHLGVAAGLLNQSSEALGDKKGTYKAQI